MIETLVALDFDGTLAPIRIDPTAVELDPVVVPFLDRLAARDDVALALISGRDLEDLAARSSGVSAWKSGAHGRELARPDGEIVASMEPLGEEPGDEWHRLVEESGMRVERKKFGIALHWRGLDGVDDSHPAVVGLREWASERGLHESPGRAVLEVARGDAGKQRVLEELARRLDARRVVYAGDDLTDFPAIEWAARHGAGIFVRSEERSESPEGAIEVTSTGDLIEAIEKEIEQR